MNRLSVFFVAVTGLFLAPWLPAATFTVNTTADEFNTPSGGNLSLREALRDAAAAGGGDDILFNVALSGQTITLGSEIVISDASAISVDASALAAGLTIDGGPGNNRLFTLAPGTPATLVGLKLTGGNGTGAAATGYGGAIFNQSGATLHLTRCTLSGNTATNGAALVNAGICVGAQSTFSDNRASSQGGAIQNEGTISLTQCTLSGNQAGAYGGAIENINGISGLTHCTLSGNRAGTAGGGVDNFHGTFNLSQCIVAGNTGTVPRDLNNDGGTVARNGTNLVQSVANVSGGTQSGPTAINADPLLHPLGNYGGRTETRALQGGSPAINAATGSGITTDQRGVAIVDTPDVGAFELKAVIVTTVADELNVPAGANLSLREAVRDVPAGGSILFDTSLFNGETADQITLGAGGELTVGKDVIIDAGNISGGVTIAGNGSNRLFTVSSGFTVNFLRLNLTGGRASGSFPSAYGGGVYNQGTLSLSECSLSGHQGFGGGAVYNTGTLTLNRSTISGNAAFAGGGIQNEGTLVSKASTIALNSASQEGGGISAPFNQPVTLVHTTISSNSAAATGGGVIGGNITANYSILAHNSAPAGPNQSGTLSGSNNVINVEPFLAPLDDYGGPTLTMALLPASPARNLATNSTATSDQRGFPIVGIPDAGAYESGTMGSNFYAFIWESLPTSSAAVHAPDFDYDGDGHNNLGEYAALTDPAVANAAPFLLLTLNPALTVGTNSFAFRAGASDLHYELSRSTNLTVWSNIFTLTTASGAANTFGAGVNANSNGTQMTVTDTTVAGQPKNFYRLRVKLLP